MDPPTYGRGSTGEMWKLEDHLWELLTECRALLSDRPLFFLINAYTARLSPTVVANLLAELMAGARRHAHRRRSRPADPARRQGPPLRHLRPLGGDVGERLNG
jgi:23S rRNA G2069 N7-methylase RlmK/C1962 C5-methylase RlmI